MKWTFVSLAAAGALTYGLIFFVHAQRDARRVPVRAGHGSATAQALAAGSGTSDAVDSGATLATADVSKKTTLPQPVETAAEPEAPPPRWDGDAWPAGLQAYQSGDYALAVDALEAAVAEREDVPYRHYLLGLSYLKNDEPEGAVEELERSLELSPGNVRGLVNLGRAQLALEQPVQARAAVDAALELDLKDADAWNVLGRIELTEGSLEPAAAAFEKAVEIDPAHAYAWNNLGYVRILQERFEDAVEPLRHATASGLDVPYFFNNLGVALERVDDLTGAAEAFAKARDLGHPVAAVSLARVETIVLARGDSTGVSPSPAASLDDEMAVVAGETAPDDVVGEN